MRRWRRAALLAAVAAGMSVGAWTALTEEPEWPPGWYVEATSGPEAHLATWTRLRRRAVNPRVNPPDTDFPPDDAKLDLLRLIAAGADRRPLDARVYFSNTAYATEIIHGSPSLQEGASVYVLALRGRFSTEHISRPSSIKRPMPEHRPMLIHVVDAATMNTISGYLGRLRDLSPLGESIELDLDEEPF